jgi:hypothetical protein
VAVSFIGGGNRSTRRKSSTCRKSLTLTYCCIENISPGTGFELTTLVVIVSDCTDSCNSNYHTITTTTPPYMLVVVPYTKCMNMIIIYNTKTTNHHNQQYKSNYTNLLDLIIKSWIITKVLQFALFDILELPINKLSLFCCPDILIKIIFLMCEYIRHFSKKWSDDSICLQVQKGLDSRFLLNR